MSPVVTANRQITRADGARGGAGIRGPGWFLALDAIGL